MAERLALRRAAYALLSGNELAGFDICELASSSPWNYRPLLNRVLLGD
jgi:hypothetical protein